MRLYRLLAIGLLTLAVAAASSVAEDRYFDSNGVKIHYQIKGQGEPVLLIHGFTANIQMQWTTVIRALEDDYQVIAIDNRGHGRSDKPHDPQKYGLEMVEDQVRLLDHLHIDRAHVVGYSMGGFITNKLLTMHPERLKSATLGGAGWRRDTDDLRANLMNRLADSLEAGQGITPLIEFLTPEGEKKPSAEQLRVINEMVMLINDPKALAAVIRGMGGLTVPEEKLRENKVPVLALIGDRDPLKESVDALATVMPDLQLIVIPGADHMSAPSRKEFITGLKDFLAAHRDTNSETAKNGTAKKQEKLAAPVGAAR